MLVGTQDEALPSARQVLRRNRWEVLDVRLVDQLADERVREQGGEALALYETALKNGSALRIFPQHFGAGRSGLPVIRPPRVTEEFIDRVVADVGGLRLAECNERRTADYRIGEWLFELKDLQEEGLERPERQAKLAELFEPFAEGDLPIRLDPELLPADQRRAYFDILSGPIKTQVKSASKQIRSTKEALGEPDLRGGIIYLNTGYGSYPNEEFGPTVERYVENDTTQIEAVFCASTYSVTNGFDSYVFFRTHPKEPEHQVVGRLQEAFGRRFEEAMTKLMRGELADDAAYSDPLRPVTFRVGGLDYSWEPPVVPKPVAQA